MRRSLAIIALACLAAPAPAAAIRFEGWTATCAGEAPAVDCRVAAATSDVSGARELTIAVTRAGAPDAAPRMTLTVAGAAGSTERLRVALAVDGGTPVRLAAGADIAVAPGAQAGATEIRLSEGATRRLLPFMRRGKILDIEIVGEEGRKLAGRIALPGLAPAFSEVDRAQARTDKPDALIAMVGGGTPAALSGQVRDIRRDAVPATLRQMMVDRDCPVWDASETDPSFLADESFAADLGSGRTLWAIVCASGAYNVEFALFVEDPSRAADRFEPLLFAAFVESVGWTGVDRLSNAAYEPSKKQLTAFEKGRGVGDCGTVGTWEWGGAAFRMVEYRAKEECDGVGEPGKFPIVFRGER